MKIVYQDKTKTGKEIVVRYPQIGDEKEMWRYINELSKEKTFVRFQGEEITLDEEVKYLKDQLRLIGRKTSVKLLVFFENKLIGITEVNMRDKTEKHVGILGISIAKDFRGEGLGKLLIELILKEAQKELPNLKIVTLEVYSTNDIAKKMYNNFGFMEYGRLPKGITRNEEFEDAILMYKNIK